MMKAAKGSGIGVLTWTSKLIGLGDALPFLITFEIISDNYTYIYYQNEMFGIQEAWVNYARNW